MKIVYYTFLIAAGINICFLLSYAFALFFKAHKQRTKKRSDKTVSIVVAARNEVKNLAKLIPALLEQDYSQKEIIIVNDRSDDQTAALLEKFSNIQVVTISKLPSTYNGKKYALQQGIKAAVNDYILLTDADCLPSSKEWISNIMHTYTPNKEIVLGLSFYRKEPGFLNKFIQFETFFTAIKYTSFALLGMPYMGVGRNISYTKKLFDTNKFDGYENKTGGDDDLFINKNANKKNIAVCFSQESITMTDAEPTLKKYINQKIRHLSIGKFYPKGIKILLGLESLSSFVFYIFGIILLISSSYKVNTVIIFSVRTVILFLIFIKFTKLTKHKKQLMLLLMEDLCYQFYNWILGSVAYFRKGIRWK